MKLIIDTLEQARLNASPSDAMQLADAIADLLALEQGLEGMTLDELPGALDDLAALREHIKVQPFDIVYSEDTEAGRTILDELTPDAFAEWLGELERLAE